MPRKVGKRGRGRTKPTTTSTTAGPSWKPAKATTTGNYGQAVSAAAKARNAARRAGVPAPGANTTGSAQPIQRGKAIGKLPASTRPAAMPSSRTGGSYSTLPVGEFKPITIPTERTTKKRGRSAKKY